MKKVFGLAVALLVATAMAAVAGGGQEQRHVDVVGTVIEIAPDDSGDEVIVVVTTDEGQYSVELSQAIVDEMGLSVGDELSIAGVVTSENEDGTTFVSPEELEINGQSVVVDDSPGDRSNDDPSDLSSDDQGDDSDDDPADVSDDESDDSDDDPADMSDDDDDDDSHDDMDDDSEDDEWDDEEDD